MGQSVLRRQLRPCQKGGAGVGKTKRGKGTTSRPFYEAVGGDRLGSQEIEIGVIALEEVAYGWDDIRSLTVSH
jgi:hypothetical protein